MLLTGIAAWTTLGFLAGAGVLLDSGMMRLSASGRQEARDMADLVMAGTTDGLLNLGPGPVQRVRAGEDAFLYLPLNNRGPADVITRVETSCGCTQVYGGRETDLMPGDPLPTGGSGMTFRVATAGAPTNRLKGTITVELASGRRVSVGYLVRIIPGAEIEGGETAPRVLEAAPGELAQHRLVLRFPEQGCRVQSVDVIGRRVQAKARWRMQDERPFTWAIDLAWTPGPDSRDFKDELVIGTNIGTYRVPVHGRVRRPVTLEPEHWVLGGLSQEGPLRAEFQLRGKDAALREWRMDGPQGVNVIPGENGKFTVTVDIPAYAASLGQVEAGRPVVKYLILNAGTEVRLPLIAVP
jgi:hypothetical protein